MNANRAERDGCGTAGARAVMLPDPAPGPAADRSSRQQRKRETRERLLDAARELFVLKGFEETTFDDIAQCVGVARQTVFNHFPRKEDFVIAWGARRREEVDRVLSSSAFEGEPATARMVLIMRVLADFYERSPVEGRVFTVAWVKWGGPVFEEPLLAGQFAAVIAEGQLSGEIRGDVNAQAAGQMMRAAYFDALWRWAAPDRPPGAPSLFSDMLTRLELLLTGLCVAPDRESLKQSMRLARAIESTHRGPNRNAPVDPL